MGFLTDFLKGLVIGIGAVAPGVSGGAFAVMLGVYTKLTESLANIFHNFREKVKMLYPLALGMVAGFLLFSRVMKYLFENYEFEVRFLFVGLMLGTISTVFKEANKNGFSKKYLLPCIFSFLITIIFMILENGQYINLIPNRSPSILDNIIYGGVLGFGTIVPGVSSSFILMYIGVYEYLLDAMVSFNLLVIIPVAIGGLAGILLFSKFINYMFHNFYGYTYYVVIGFVSGSILSILPIPSSIREYILGLIVCIVGFIISFSLSRLGRE